MARGQKVGWRGSVEDRILRASNEHEAPYGLEESCLICELTPVFVYAKVWLNGKQYPAHRYMYEAAHGVLKPWPEEIVCHHCDRPRCVRLSHLRHGVPADNSADMVLRDRQARGARNGRAKLTAAQVGEIRILCESGFTKAEVARRFGVTDVLVGKIIRKEAWANG